MAPEPQALEGRVKFRFSIVIPVYNRAKFLRQAIDSVLSQTFTDYEVIAVDDGSTDESLEILKSYGSRIRVIRQENQGPEVARNTGVAVAQGEYIAFLDSDDFFFPHTLETYERVIQNFEAPPMIVGAELYFRHGQEIPKKAYETGSIEVISYKDYLSKTMSILCCQSILAMRKSVFDEVGGHRGKDAETWYGETFDLLLKTGTYGPCVFIKKPYTFAYRVHESNSIRNVQSHAKGILYLARLELQGRYPGGSKRRWDRYAIIGGVASTWALRYCWRGKQRMLAIKLLLGTAPMVLAAVVKKSLRYFTKPPRPVVLPEVQPQPKSQLEMSIPEAL
jgi:glycosyltransferase involved in cell wall biosynthesis